MQRINSKLHYNDLKPGDILLFYSTEHKFYIHAAVVASKKYDNIHYTLHAVFKPSRHMHFKPPYSVEGLAEIKREMHAFRIEDPIIRERMIKIMEVWANFAVKFDNERLDKALARARETLDVQWDYSKKQFPAMSTVSVETFTKAVANIQAEFNIDDAIKYAVRRDTSPVKPHLKDELDHGFQCQMFVLAALQAAYLADDVPSIKTEWCSLRNSIFANPVNLIANLQKTGLAEMKEKLTQKIPSELRLSLRYCEPELFYQAIKNSSHITQLGEVEPLLEAQIPEVMKDDELKIKFITEGIQNKIELHHQLKMSP